MLLVRLQTFFDDLENRSRLTGASPISIGDLSGAIVIAVGLPWQRSENIVTGTGTTLFTTVQPDTARQMGQTAKIGFATRVVLNGQALHLHGSDRKLGILEVGLLFGYDGHCGKRRTGASMAFYELEKLHRLHDGYQKAFRVAGHELLLVQQEGRPYLVENRCPHMDAPLTKAQQEPGIIRCRIHGIEFKLEDGQACGPLAGTLSSLKFYPLAYEGTALGVDL